MSFQNLKILEAEWLGESTWLIVQTDDSNNPLRAVWRIEVNDKKVIFINKLSLAWHSPHKKTVEIALTEIQNEYREKS